MNLSDHPALKNPELDVRAIPMSKIIRDSVSRIVSRWPHIVGEPNDADRERLAMEVLSRVREWRWDGIKTSRTIAAASAVFDKERIARDDLSPVREFYYAEISASTNETFLTSMFWVYVDSFTEDGEHTKRLAGALREKASLFSVRARGLIEKLPMLLIPTKAPLAISHVMAAVSNPFEAMKELGFRSPHVSGLTQVAHGKFVENIAPSLGDKVARASLFRWLRPESNVVLQNGAGIALEAILAIWVKRVPPDDVRNEIVEWITSSYNDPRTRPGGVWASFDPELKALFLRWLTKQDMLFFCDMVTATQSSHMWPERRDFWLQLYEDGRIQEAWVAFGTDAWRYAQRRIASTGGSLSTRRFGRQSDRGASTSLLIMKISGKTVVDGCQNYRTHIFESQDTRKPELYRSEYYCDEIMRRASNSKSHSSIENWKLWVLRNV